MLKGLKIHTAAFICLVFIFRLLFINVGLVSSLFSQQQSASVKHHLSSVMKRRKHFDAAGNAVSYGSLSVAIIEEDSDDDEQFKLNPFFLLHVFYSKVETKINDVLKKINPFNKHFSFNSSNRYIEYHVFRI